jgi:hypothetical protein
MNLFRWVHVANLQCRSLAPVRWLATNKKRNRMKDIEFLKQSIVRFISISGIIIAFAYLVYGRSVFISTQWPVQFFVSGITIGLAFITFRERYYREGLALLVLWYIILIGLATERHRWIFILEATYISIISIAVYFCIKIVQKLFISNEFLRIATFTVILGVSNSFIIIVLYLFSFSIILSHLPQIFDAMYLNLKIGTMLGLFMGVGIELSDIVINSAFFKKVAS